MPKRNQRIPRWSDEESEDLVRRAAMHPELQAWDLATLHVQRWPVRGWDAAKQRAYKLRRGEDGETITSIKKDPMIQPKPEAKKYLVQIPCNIWVQDPETGHSQQCGPDALQIVVDAEYALQAAEKVGEFLQRQFNVSQR